MLSKTDTDARAAEQDRAAQKGQLDQTVNERAKADIARSSQAPEDDSDKEERLGVPLATIPE